MANLYKLGRARPNLGDNTKGRWGVHIPEEISPGDGLVSRAVRSRGQHRRTPAGRQPFFIRK